MKEIISNKKQSHNIERLWLDTFAGHLKDHRGKYLVGRYKWENFSSHSPNATFGTKAQTIVNDKEKEDYFLFNESASECWECKNEGYPLSAPTGDDWYLLPKSLSWTYIFTHHNEVIYLENDT